MKNRAILGLAIAGTIGFFAANGLTTSAFADHHEGHGKKAKCKCNHEKGECTCKHKEGKECKKCKTHKAKKDAVKAEEEHGKAEDHGKAEEHGAAEHH